LIGVILGDEHPQRRGIERRFEGRRRHGRRKAIEAIVVHS
jgi:hypothetical protein